MISGELQGPGWYSECCVDCWLMFCNILPVQHAHLTLDSRWVQTKRPRWWGDQRSLVHPFPPDIAYSLRTFCLFSQPLRYILLVFFGYWTCRESMALVLCNQIAGHLFLQHVQQCISRKWYTVYDVQCNHAMYQAYHHVQYQVYVQFCIHVLNGWKHNTGTLQWLHGLFWESLWYRFSSYMGEFHPVRSTHVYSKYI